MITSRANLRSLGSNHYMTTVAAFPYLAQKFVETGIYQQQEEIRALMTENEYFDFGFSKMVSEKLNDEQLEKMLEKKEVFLQVDEKALRLLKKKGISEEFGAREVERVIRNEIKPLLVDEILFGALKNGGKLFLTVQQEKFAVQMGE